MIITREHHAFEGRALAAISSIRRRGVLFVLVALPDGSRSLIPAKWTDWNAEPTTRTPLDDADDSGVGAGIEFRLCFSLRRLFYLTRTETGMPRLVMRLRTLQPIFASVF